MHICFSSEAEKVEELELEEYSFEDFEPLPLSHKEEDPGGGERNYSYTRRQPLTVLPPPVPR